MKLSFLIILCNLALCLSASAETSLWVVNTDRSVTYIGGTSHVLRASDYPLPHEFEVAYANSDAIVLEANPSTFASPEIQQQLLRDSIYKGEMSLDKVLKPKTFNLLRNYCESSGIPVTNLIKFKPSMVAMVLVVFELQKLGSAESGVDFHFHNRATTDKKLIGELETAEQQMGFLLSMGEGNEDQFIQHTIADLKNTREFFESFILAWRNGNEAELEALLITGTKEASPDIYKTLFQDRNTAWLPKFEKYIGSRETEFILVGVGHLVGEDGLIATLRSRGFDVRKLK